MAKKKGMMIASLILVILASIVNFGSHIMIFASGLPVNIQNLHAITNIVAGILVIVAFILLWMYMKKR